MIIEVYITKHALTKGIWKANADDLNGKYDGMIAVGDLMNRQYFHYEGTEWHRTFESAKAKAEAMRDKKIASLKKQIAKLKAMTFEEVK